jgi:tetratricopeptide (TPR) repeat protein
MADVKLFGLHPGAHHLVNMLLHSLNGVLVFWLLRCSAGAFWRSAFVAALFALHPTHVESVAWVAERKDVLSAFFGLSCLTAYCAYTKRRTSEGAEASTNKGFLSSPIYWTALALLALGLMSKPMLVTLPCVMVLLDFWPLNRFKDSKSFAHLMAEKIPLFVLVGASCVITVIAQREGGAVQSLGDMSLISRLENAVVSYVRYLEKVFWPTNLATPYPHPGDWPNLLTVGCVLLLALLSGGVWFFRRRWPFVLVGWLWFLGMLVPVIGIVQVGAQSMADRYTYLPYIGIFMALVWSGHAAMSFRAEKMLELNGTACSSAAGNPRASGPVLQRPWIAAVLATGLLLSLGLITRKQIAVWRNSETLFRHAISVTTSNWLAYYNLGWHFDRQGKVDEALGFYRKAAQIEPRFPNSWNNIGCALASRKQYEDAIPYFEKARAMQVSAIEVNLNLANALREVGKIESAIELYQSVLENRPANKVALNALGTLLVGKRDFGDAILYLEKALELDPSQPSIHYSLANALVKLRRLPEALEHYQQAASNMPDSSTLKNDYALCLARLGRINEAVHILQEARFKHPQDATICVTFGRVLANQQRFDEAVPLFIEALKLAPDNADAHASLGPLLAMKGETEQAIDHLEKALTSKADDPVVHFNLGRALVSQGKTSEAERHFKESLRLRPDYSPAQIELRKLENDSNP